MTGRPHRRGRRYAASVWCLAFRQGPIHLALDRALADVKPGVRQGLANRLAAVSSSAKPADVCFERAGLARQPPGRLSRNQCHRRSCRIHVSMVGVSRPGEALDSRPDPAPFAAGEPAFDSLRPGLDSVVTGPGAEVTGAGSLWTPSFLEGPTAGEGGRWNSYRIQRPQAL